MTDKYDDFLDNENPPSKEVSTEKSLTPILDETSKSNPNLDTPLTDFVSEHPITTGISAGALSALSAYGSAKVGKAAYNWMTGKDSTKIVTEDTNDVKHAIKTAHTANEVELANPLASLQEKQQRISALMNPESTTPQIGNVDPVEIAKQKQKEARKALQGGKGQYAIPPSANETLAAIDPESSIKGIASEPITISDSTKLKSSSPVKIPETIQPFEHTTPAAKEARNKLTYKFDDANTAKQLLQNKITFMPNYGPGDNHLFNTYGNEGRKAIIGEFNGGMPAGSYENARSLESKLQDSRVGPAIPKDIRNERGIPPSGFGNFGKLGTAMRVGGILGLGIAGADLANAKPAQRAEIAGNTAMGFMPPALQALTYSGNAGDPNESQNVFNKFYASRVGGGRGFVNQPQGGPVDPKAEWEKMRKAGFVTTQWH